MILETERNILRMISERSDEFEDSLDSDFRKQSGSYYTSMELTLTMVNELLEKLKLTKKNVYDLKFLEPCVGTGNFVFAYIVTASKGLSKQQIVKLINNIYVCDINEKALDVYKKNLSLILSSLYRIELNDEYYEHHIGKGLLFNLTEKIPRYIPITEIFGEKSKNSFDIVITNPPYKNLKAELGHYQSIEDRNKDKIKYDTVSAIVKKQLPFTSSGTLNIYKLFVEEILNNYAAKDALVSILVPTSILTDKTCERVRKYIIERFHIISIKNIAENNQFIDAQQALSAILMDKSTEVGSSKKTSICKLYNTGLEESTDVYIRDLANKDNGYTILALSKNDNQILQAMLKFPKIKDLSFISNLRGELDLTNDKKSIVERKTPYTLIRGRNIGYYQTLFSGDTEYVEDLFVNKSSKSKYIHMSRMACQQISNMAKERRLTFSKIEPMSVLANSCNFIALTQNNSDIDINYLYGLLNSKLMNWYFKIHSSNNHINNYEIDNFPVPIEGKAIKQISKLVSKMNSFDQEVLSLIDDLVCELFGVSVTNQQFDVSQQKNDINSPLELLALKDCRYIIPELEISDIHDMLNNSQSIESTILKFTPSLSIYDKKVLGGIIEKYKKQSKDIVLNHTTFKLSDLDMEMIRPIPQGGNWKDIPEVTVNKSRRLKRITETGGRTTLYGRLDYQKPSYTITTYFNRPGNGTYVHPVHDRVLTVREAARLQSFTDDYYFFGNKSQVLKQIGNAVPAILAYQIGAKIKNSLGNVKSVDLFAGAGGLTLGLKNAGIDTVLCTDFDEAACVTLKINNPEIEVVCGDITESAVKESIIESCINNNIDIVCGGPPCQGFSMAGYRDEKDPRNQLFKEFVYIVEKSSPKVVIFENVQGILTFKGGETYNAIHELFSELGYKTEGRLLKIDQYGVPQKRKRVIIICTRNDLDIEPSDLYPDAITSLDEAKITVADTISDLESLNCDEDVVYLIQSNKTSSIYSQMLRGTKSVEEYVRELNPSKENKYDNVQLSLLGSY